MKNTKPNHTPGPWEIDATTCDGEETWIVSTSLDRAVCLVGMHKEDEQFVFNRANANLIAAAPDMLREIQDTIVAIIDFQRQCEADEYTDTDLVHDLLNNIFVDLKRIAEKAKGEVE